MTTKITRKQMAEMLAKAALADVFGDGENTVDHSVCPVCGEISVSWGERPAHFKDCELAAMLETLHKEGLLP